MCSNRSGFWKRPMLQDEIERLFDAQPVTYTEAHFRLFQVFKDALNAGEVRAAEPDPSSKSGWRVNGWVRKGILIGFRMGALVDQSSDRIRQPLCDSYRRRVMRFSNA